MASAHSRGSGDCRQDRGTKSDVLVGVVDLRVRVEAVAIHLSLHLHSD